MVCWTFRFSFALLILVASSTVHVVAQSESGGAALQGVVVDQHGASVAGATVTIKNLDTGNIRTLTSDEEGRFVAQAIAVGHYQIEATASGSRISRTVQVQLTVGQSESVMLTVRPTAAEAASKMVVKSGERKLDARESAAATSLLLSTMEETPVRGRAFTDFVQLTLGIVQESARSGLVIAGQRSIYSNISIDGNDYNDPLQGNQRGGNEPIFFFPLTAVREFQVVHAGATAEVGRTNAGFVNVATRSGTNQWHGEHFYLNRNRAFTSPDAFNQPVDISQHQFGGAMGGPIKRDRVFQFVSVEQNLLRLPFQVTFQPQSAGVSLPANLLALQGSKTSTNDVTALFTRTDVNLTSRHTLNVQYGYSMVDGRNFFVGSNPTSQAESTNASDSISSHSIRLGMVSVFGGDRVNELRSQVATDNRDETPNLASSLINISGVGQIGGDAGRPRIFDNTRYQVTDNFSLTRGAHRLRFGADWNRTPEIQVKEGNIQGRYDFTSLADYIAGNISRYRGTITAFNPEDFKYRGAQQDFALFAQDKLPLARDIMLTAGLRWEGQWNPQPPRPNPAFPQTTRVPNDLSQWQPRLGLAWDVRGTGETVVRVFAGIYAAHTPGTLLQREFTDNGLTTLFLDSRFDRNVMNFVQFPNTLTSLPPGVRRAPGKVVGFDSNFRNPRSFQTGAALERALNSETVVSLEYLHNSTWALQRRLDHNLFPATIDATGMPIFPLTRPNPTIGPLSINESGSHEDYNALILTVRRRLAHRLQFQAGYVLSRNRDDDSNERNSDRETALNPLDPSLERAYSNHDVRHNFNFNGLVNLPYGFSASAVMLAHSGLPYTPVIGFDTQNDGNDSNDRAIINGRVTGRNSMRQDSFFDLDLRILKAFAMGAERRLHLFADFYNVARSPNKNFGSFAVSTFGSPANPSPTAGVPLFAPNTARFGGPRQVQLGLRFVF